MIKNKKLSLFYGIVIILTPSLAYCAASNNHVHLDRSEDVLFDQLSGNNFSLQLLQVKDKFKKQDLIIGGSADFDFQHWQGNPLITDTGNLYQQGTHIYFTQASYDMMTNFNTEWTTAFFTASLGHLMQNNQDANVWFFPHAFLLFGNLDKTPFYLTLGVSSIPFGIFSGTGSWNIPLTATYLNPAQAPQVSFGYNKNGFNFMITKYKDQINYDYHSVYNVYYNKSIDSVSYGVGAGYSTNLKSNITGNAIINPARNNNIFAFNLGNISDLNGNFGYGPFAFTIEYAQASKVVGINRNKSKAMGETLSYYRSIFGRDTTFGIGFSNTLNLNSIPAPLTGQDAIPETAAGIKNAWVASISRAILTDYMVLGFNAEKDATYSDQKTYTYTLDLTAYL